MTYGKATYKKNVANSLWAVNRSSKCISEGIQNNPFERYDFSLQFKAHKTIWASYFMEFPLQIKYPFYLSMQDKAVELVALIH